MTPDETRTENVPKAPGSPGYDVLSVDVEDYYHVEAFADRVSPSSWPDFPSRVRANTKRVLQIFEEHGCRATFFVLGWVAERDPALVREIVEAGHEVACHSYNHRRVGSLTPEEFREDLRRARAVIEDAAGVRILGYRAPTFSIGRDSLWALEILSEERFLYDSSIFRISRRPTFPVSTAIWVEADAVRNSDHHGAHRRNDMAGWWGWVSPISAYAIHAMGDPADSREGAPTVRPVLPSLGARS